MALKMDRQVDAVDITFFLNETCSRGKVLSLSTAGSGTSLDDPAALLTVAGSSSGAKPIGLLLNDFVNLDLTRVNVNWHKDEAQIGTKASVLTKGWVVTDQVVGTPTAGDLAALGSSGTIIVKPAAATYNVVLNPIVGHFRSKVDQDGFAKVYIDL